MLLNKDKKVKILYTNYRGETKIREIIPEKIWYGTTEWHPENDWILDAFDLEKKSIRSFSIKDIKAWFK